MSQRCSIVISLPQDADKVLEAYVRGKKEGKSQLRDRFLQPLIRALNVSTREDMLPYRDSVLGLIAAFELSTSKFNRTHRGVVGTTDYTELELYSMPLEEPNKLTSYEMAVRRNAQKKMSKEWNFLMSLWFNAVSKILCCMTTTNTHSIPLYTGLYQPSLHSNRRVLGVCSIGEQRIEYGNQHVRLVAEGSLPRSNH